MKAKPINSDQRQVAPEEATHLLLRLPGPVGQIILPVMLHGRREGTGNWTWNGNVDKPTLKPSVLQTAGCHVDGFNRELDSCWCKYNREHPEEKPHFHCYRCHTWINDGRAIFLDDCSHELKGQTLDLLEVE